MYKLFLAAALFLPLAAALPAHSQGVQLPSAPNAAPVPGTVPPGGVGLPHPQSASSQSAYRRGVRQARRRALTPPPGTTPLR